jgi:hypothetical protein
VSGLGLCVTRRPAWEMDRDRELFSCFLEDGFPEGT